MSDPDIELVWLGVSPSLGNKPTCHRDYVLVLKDGVEEHVFFYVSTLKRVKLGATRGWKISKNLIG